MTRELPHSKGCLRAIHPKCLHTSTRLKTVLTQTNLLVQRFAPKTLPRLPSNRCWTHKITSYRGLVYTENITEWRGGSKGKDHKNSVL